MRAKPCLSAPSDPSPANMFPDWVPEGVRVYLSHTAGGMSLRALARSRGCHASTIMRQVRRFENRRDDPLVDEALSRLDAAMRRSSTSQYAREAAMTIARPVTVPVDQADAGNDDQTIDVLRHLTTPGAVLVVAPDMPKAVVMLETATGQTARIAVLDRNIAEIMALRDWIACSRPGRVSCYSITATGEAALLTHGANDRCAPSSGGQYPSRRARYGQAESPVSILARRREKSGEMFLHPALVSAAERLREDFAMAQLDGMALQPSEQFVKALEDRRLHGANIAKPGTRAARLRVQDVLRELGPGLADIALRCCCHLEGVESAENALGWSARSGKIVLRIALQRLKRHYDLIGKEHMMIG
ncbi:DUF6456 domain-containing protein [Roseinatronobacter alkalisoli]|uniref:DUF6456 domain-containing protein n=1 Tax=Roseinatronobacter alkalisoli TaxID=3028235 RepID=A0ABT5T6X8_9RHOB|nr:DUF6456 domain-containing protein [Roseinatronobacter sp. HJB301]MDD7970867.1 DUF6456 domain-containing protein [Roseinatronobacter sp. HJB301]